MHQNVEAERASEAQHETAASGWKKLYLAPLTKSGKVKEQLVCASCSDVKWRADIEEDVDVLCFVCGEPGVLFTDWYDAQAVRDNQ